MLENENVLFLFRAGKTLWSCFRLVDCSARANHVWLPGSAPREQGMTFDGESTYSGLDKNISIRSTKLGRCSYVVYSCVIFLWITERNDQFFQFKMLCHVSLPDFVVKEFKLREKARGQELLQEVSVVVV